MPSPSLPPPAHAPRRRPKRSPVVQKKRSDVPLHMLSGLQLLVQAYEYAEETRRNHDDFAVELTELRRCGMTNADCRWVVCKGWAQLVREVQREPGEARRFDRDVGLMICEHACLVLTPAGVQCARQWMRNHSHEQAPQRNGRSGPHWDRDRHELRFGSVLVKQFKLPSPNQEMILMALEEEGWPPRIDDPLPASKEVHAKQRLHDTIKSLNRKQKTRLLRFMGDGTGQGIRWEFIFQSAPAAPKVVVRGED